MSMKKHEQAKKAPREHSTAVAKCFARMANYSDHQREKLDEKLTKFLCPDSGAQVRRS
jgi:hypothetical protein